MTATAKYSIPFRLGRALGGVARFCIHDVNPAARWIKRAFVATILMVLLVNSISWLLSALLTVISLVLGIFAFSKVEYLTDDSSFFEHDQCNSIPMKGEYEHPDYYMYHKE